MRFQKLPLVAILQLCWAQLACNWLVIFASFGLCSSLFEKLLGIDGKWPSNAVPLPLEMTKVGGVACRQGWWSWETDEALRLSSRLGVVVYGIWIGFKLSWVMEDLYAFKHYWTTFYICLLGSSILGWAFNWFDLKSNRTE